MIILVSKDVLYTLMKYIFLTWFREFNERSLKVKNSCCVGREFLTLNAY